MVQVGRLAQGQSEWLPEVRSQKKRAPGSQSFPEPVEWAGETQKRVRVLLRARVERRAPLFPGDLAWPLPTWAQRTRVRVVLVPGILVGARRIQTQRLQSIEPARLWAWQPLGEQATQLAPGVQSIYPSRTPLEENLQFAR